MIPALDDPGFNNDIANIATKREVLQQIIDIAKAIENMQDSLDSVLTLGTPSKEMSDEVMDLHSKISDNLRSLPVNKLKEYQENLERIVRHQLDKILGYAGVDFTSDDGIETLTISSESTEENPLDLVESFKRTAQTTVSLRVLLRKRGVAVPGANLPVPKDVIEEQLEHLKVQEEGQRRKIKDKIDDMQKDIESMIQNPAYPAGMKEMLKGAKENLRNDIDRLARGAPLSALSLVVDAEELVVSAVEDDSEEIELQALPPEDEKSGLSETAARWLNSPWNVSWDDAKHGRNS